MNGSHRHRETGSARSAGESWHDLPEAVKYGDLCYQAERYGDALEAYLEVLRTTPRNALPAAARARLHYRLASCYQRRGSYAQALEHLDLARQALPRHIDRVQLAKIYSRRGQIMVSLGRYARAERFLRWAKKLLADTDAHEELATVELRLGHVFTRRGLHQEALTAYMSALATYRRIGDRNGEARSLNNLGLQYKNACQWREAIHYLEQARTLSERIGYNQQLVSTNLNLGIAHFKLGKWELAEEHLTTAERLAGQLGSDLLLVSTTLALGNVALRRRRWDEAEALYKRALGGAEEQGFARESILAQEFLGELSLERGEPERAVRFLEAALPRAREMAADGDLVDEILRRLAEVRLLQGRFEEALDLAGEAVAVVERNGDRYERPLCLRVMALAQLELGDTEAGHDLMDRCLEEIEAVGDPYQKAWTHLYYGRYRAQAAVQSAAGGDLEAAAQQLQRAYGAFLDLDAFASAALAAYERAVLESKFGRLEEAAVHRAKARRVLPPGGDPVLETRLERLAADLESAFTERWSNDGDVLASLREMKRLFQGASGTEGVLEELTRLAATRSRSSRGCVAHLDADGKLSVIAVFGWTPDEAASLLDLLGDEVAERMQDTRPVWSNNTAEDERYHSLARRFRSRSFVLLPLELSEQRHGFLYVDKVGDKHEIGYQEGDLNLLTILANLAALSIIERSNLQLSRENKQLREQIGIEDEERFVTTHPPLKETLRLVSKVANSPVSILIEGETGTGKGLLSQIIHDASNRSDKPFVQINCAALPEQLLESELFGHVKGAFTGATFNKVGLFKEAEQGTLFLDEVDKTSLAVQAKLLHVMDSKEVRPVGSVKSYQVDTRVICATNTDLRERIQAGEFLEDLYYRLNDFTLRVPPLRDRREDIPLLLDHFLRKFARQYDRPGVAFSPEVRRVLLDQSWRGNVRELEKTVRRLVVLAEDGVPAGSDLLPSEVGGLIEGNNGGKTLRDEVAKTERRVIADALRANGWNKAQVARELKVSYPCLLKKIKDFQLSPTN